MLYVVDTNVVSQMMSQTPDLAIVAWFAAHAQDEFATTTISQAEVFSGILRLPEGKKKKALETAATAIFNHEFLGRIHPLDSQAAVQAGRNLGLRTQLGKPISFQDACIAAIAKVKGAAVLTRDVTGFAQTGVLIVNPWADA